jgi:hypothetical protein
MTLDEPHRKLYIGDTQGVVRMFNVLLGIEMTKLRISAETLVELKEDD